MTMDPTAQKHLAELTVEFFNRCGEEAELSERMSFADTTVHIHFVDPEGETACTVWLDKTPISAEIGIVGSAEIELFAPSGVFLDQFRGKDKLPMAIVRGDVTYKGPVRKFLRVTPILTSFDFDMFRVEKPEASPAVAPDDAPTGLYPL